VLKKWKSFYFGIWDTAGQEKFTRISTYYSRGAQAAILAYDITDRRSFDNLADYSKFLGDAEKGCYVVFIGTKLDLVREDPSRRQVTEEIVREFAGQFSAPCFETSAKDGLNVASVFDTIGYHCFATRLAATPAAEASPAAAVLARAPSYADTRPAPTEASTVCCTIQ
jgi:Ras-related protein Rab-20